MKKKLSIPLGILLLAFGVGVAGLTAGSNDEDAGNSSMEAQVQGAIDEGGLEGGLQELAEEIEKAAQEAGVDTSTLSSSPQPLPSQEGESSESNQATTSNSTTQASNNQSTPQTADGDDENEVPATSQPSRGDSGGLTPVDIAPTPVDDEDVELEPVLIRGRTLR